MVASRDFKWLISQAHPSTAFELLSLHSVHAQLQFVPVNCVGLLASKQILEIGTLVGIVTSQHSKDVPNLFMHFNVGHDY